MKQIKFYTKGLKGYLAEKNIEFYKFTINNNFIEMNILNDNINVINSNIEYFPFEKGIYIVI
jgi:hypothetical protein